MDIDVFILFFILLAVSFITLNTFHYFPIFVDISRDDIWLRMALQLTQ